jgi:hypothetical protein
LLKSRYVLYITCCFRYNCSTCGDSSGLVPPDADTVPTDIDTVPTDTDIVPPDIDTVLTDTDMVPPDADTVPLDIPVIPQRQTWFQHIQTLLR